MKEFFVPTEKLILADDHKVYTDEEIDLMEQSLRMVGLLSPIIVTGNTNTGLYTILDGTRRYLAMKKMEFSEMICSFSCDATRVREALKLIGENH